MQNTASRPKITVSAEGQGLVSQAGMLLLAGAARVTGLGQGLSGGLARWRASRVVHDPGKILADLVMTLALGGDCLADVVVLRAQPELAGPVASDPVISRLVAALAAEGPRALTGLLDLSGWPAGMRVIVRKERPHPGAQLRFTDLDGHRFTAFATDAKAGQLADLELRHRRRARCEDRIRAAKDTRLRNLPLHGFAQNQLWCELVAWPAS